MGRGLESLRPSMFLTSPSATPHIPDTTLTPVRTAASAWARVTASKECAFSEVPGAIVVTIAIAMPGGRPGHDIGDGLSVYGHPGIRGTGYQCPG
jgi:hypothetical protein